MKKVIQRPIFTNTLKNGHSKPFLHGSVWQTQRSERQGLPVKVKLWPCYFVTFKKLNPAVAGKAILWSLYTHTKLKNPNFVHFLKAILADLVTVRTRQKNHFEASSFVLQSNEKSGHMMRPFGGRSLLLCQLMAI